jgi:uncharacterized membrane protein AbrB (regulator of aidB expression)
MIGPLAAMACCNFAGTGLRAPRGGRELGQIVIGTALGLYFTPVVAREVISYWPLLLLAGLFAIALGAGAGWILSHHGGRRSHHRVFRQRGGGAAGNDAARRALWRTAGSRRARAVAAHTSR